MIIILTFWLSMPMPPVLVNAHNLVFFGDYSGATMTNCENIWVIDDLRNKP